MNTCFSCIACVELQHSDFAFHAFAAVTIVYLHVQKITLSLQARACSNSNHTSPFESFSLLPKFIPVSEMNPSGLLLAAVLVTITIAVKSNEPSLVADYLVAVIRSLASRYPGVHQCVFFGTQLKGGAFVGTPLEQVLQDPRLDFVTRSVITMNFREEKAEVLRYPLVLLLEGERISENV